MSSVEVFVPVKSANNGFRNNGVVTDLRGVSSVVSGVGDNVRSADDILVALKAFDTSKRPARFIDLATKVARSIEMILETLFS